MGRTAYEAIAGSMTILHQHPFAPILNAGRKIVFSGPRGRRLGQRHDRRW